MRQPALPLAGLDDHGAVAAGYEGGRRRLRTRRAALQGCGGPADAAAGSSATAQEPYAVSLAGRARAHSRGAPSGPWPPPVDYLKGKD